MVDIDTPDIDISDVIRDITDACGPTTPTPGLHRSHRRTATGRSDSASGASRSFQGLLPKVRDRSAAHHKIACAKARVGRATHQLRKHYQTFTRSVADRVTAVNVQAVRGADMIKPVKLSRTTHA